MSRFESTITEVFYSFDEIDFLTIIVIIAAATALIIAVQKILLGLAEKLPGRFRMYMLPVLPTIRLIIIITAVVLIVPLLIRPTFQNFIVILGTLGLAGGFAFKDYLANIIAGFVVVYERPYGPGDWVRISDAFGEIKSMGLRSLKLYTPDDTTVTIPHGKIWDTNIHNTNAGRRNHLCVADFYLDPLHDAAKVRRRLFDVALTSPYLQIEGRIAVILAEKPWGTHYRLKAYPIDNRDQFPFISDLTVRGKEALAEMGAKPARVPVAVFDTREDDPGLSEAQGRINRNT